jgi:hypothetical protein
MTIEQIQSAAKEAEKIALTIHESIRPAAFRAIYDSLMGGQSTPISRPTSTSAGKRTNPGKLDDAETTLMEIDRTAHPEIATAGSILDRSLNVLSIASDQFGIDGLKPSQIAKVLTEKFRIKTSRQAVQQALDSAGDKVDRVPRQGGAIFRLMGGGEAYLKSKAVSA